MKIVHTVVFIGFVSISWALPKMKNRNELKTITNDMHKISSTGYNFDPKNINVDVTSNWSNSLDITAISPKNDPKEHLTVAYNITQQVVKHGDQKWVANLVLHKTANVKIYDKVTTKLHNEVWKNLTFEGGAVLVHILLSVSETFDRNVDFRNLTVPSSINYTASILTQVNISYPSPAYEDEHIYYNYLEDEMQNNNYLEDEAPFTAELIPLANVSGQEDYSSCINFDCSIGSAQIIMETNKLAEGIEARNLKMVIPDAFSFKERVSNKIAVYSAKFYIDVSYQVLISNNFNDTDY